MSTEDKDKLDSICDRCGKEVSSTETQDGPAGSDWEGSNLCNDCYAEVESENGPDDSDESESDDE